MTINVLVVDDSSFFRGRITEILNSSPQIKVIGIATNGREAVEKTLQYQPDVITMDYEMPQMDGITAVEHIMAQKPTPILMFSSLTYQGARTTLDALEAGAVDFLPKSFESVSKDRHQANRILIDRVLSISKKLLTPIDVREGVPGGILDVQSVKNAQQSSVIDSDKKTSAPAKLCKPRTSTKPGSSSSPNTGSNPSSQLNENKQSAAVARKPRLHSNQDIKIVVIGASTGGPVALQNLLKVLPANFPVPIVVVQHMPAAFTAAFADRLNSYCQITVSEAKTGMALAPGTVIIAPGGKQLMVSGQGKHDLKVMDGDERLQYKPSVDLTFASIAKAYPGQALAIIMTGMGADGCEGARLLKRDGSTIWIQDEASCVVFGMPAAVKSAGYEDETVKLDDLGRKLIKVLKCG